MEWLHELPRWFAGVVVWAAFVGVALGGLVVTRRWIRSRGLHALVDNGVVGWIFSAILAIYAITIGLTAVASWTDANDAADVASLEASVIATIYRDLDGYPEPPRRELVRGLTAYLTDIIETAWPAQRRGEVPHGGTTLLTSFQRTLHAFEPTTDGQRAIHAETLPAFNRLVEARRQRLAGIDSSVPGTLWAVVFVGAVVAIGASYMFTLESLRVHATMTVLLASMIGLLVFFIAVTDMPYRGDGGIGSDPYELVLRELVSAAGDPTP